MRTLGLITTCVYIVLLTVELNLSSHSGANAEGHLAGGRLADCNTLVEDTQQSCLNSFILLQ